MPFSITYLVSVVLFGAAFWAYSKVQGLKKLQTGTVIVPATITHREVLDGKYGAYRYWLHYAFDVDKKTVTGKAEVSARIYEVHSEGSAVEVMVQEQDTQVNYLRQVFLDRLSTYKALLVLLVTSGVFVPILF